MAGCHRLLRDGNTVALFYEFCNFLRTGEVTTKKFQICLLGGGGTTTSGSWFWAMRRPLGGTEGKPLLVTEELKEQFFSIFPESFEYF